VIWKDTLTPQYRAQNDLSSSLGTR